MRWEYRQEPGRLVLRLEDLSPADRLLVDQSHHLHVDLGRNRVWLPAPLDWVPAEGTYRPPRILYDPMSRPWSYVQWTDTGVACELSTPFPTPAPVWPKADV